MPSTITSFNVYNNAIRQVFLSKSDKEDTKIQKPITCIKSHSLLVLKSRFEPKPSSKTYNLSHFVTLLPIILFFPQVIY